jgi:signal transduction histidine kinase
MTNLIIILTIIIAIIVLLFWAIINNYINKKKNPEHKIDYKLLSYELVSIIIWILILSNIFIPKKNISTDSTSILIFVTSIILGIFLIKSIFREIEIEKTVEDLIRRLKKNHTELKKLDEQKTEFVSIASHQLRGPLSSINGYISMIVEGDFGEVPNELKQPINIIMKSTCSLGILINDFLNINKIEKGELEYIIEDFDIIELLKQKLAEFTPIAKEKSLELKYDFSFEKKEVRADKNKTKQIISNIIDNAIKYTPNGSITILITENKKNIEIIIKDTGIGISKKFGEKMFQKFVRDENAVKIEVSGTGLGLYVASVMVNAMGGKIWAESEGENRGATFHVEIPKSIK